MATASLASLGLAAALLAAQAGTAQAGMAQAGAALDGGRGSAAAVAVSGPLHPLPHVGKNSYLGRVWCLTAERCWAVGAYARANGAGANEALYWNGRKWSLTPAAEPAGTAPADNNLLVGVACASSKACWAVGFDFGFSGPVVNQALRWTGTRWSWVRTPQPGGTANNALNELTGISCPAVRECWAVGSYTNRSRSRGQILRWNGGKWSEVSIPNPAGHSASDASSLAAVTCASTRSCWAVGGYSKALRRGRVRLNEALHWNGRRWSLVATPQPAGTAATALNELSGASCTSAHNCWAVGDYGSVSATGRSLNQMLHWNGTKWSAVSAPEPDGTGRGAANSVTAVSCTSASNCWAAGDYGNLLAATEAVKNQVLHWNGKKWVRSPSPDPAGTSGGDYNALDGISCASAASCWAVGTGQPKTGTARGQALRWNGARWSGYS